jgi:hypothetical protein
MKEEYWKVKNGKEIAVGDMTEDHAKNALRLILKRDRLKKEKEQIDERWCNGDFYK